jgi:DNA-binding HxlR family transcriptional regulator
MKIQDKEILIELDERHYHCAMDITMKFIGGKWKTVVLWYLRENKKRFSELRKLMPQITERMLSIQLKQLEDDGIVQREVFGEKPPLIVEYSLTEFGETLLPVLNSIAKWGRAVGKSKGRIIDVENRKADTANLSKVQSS